MKPRVAFTDELRDENHALLQRFKSEHPHLRGADHNVIMRELEKFFDENASEKLKSIFV